jgi:hypothetical protein
VQAFWWSQTASEKAGVSVEAICFDRIKKTAAKKGNSSAAVLDNS